VLGSVVTCSGLGYAVCRSPGTDGSNPVPSSVESGLPAVTKICWILRQVARRQRLARKQPQGEQQHVTAVEYCEPDFRGRIPSMTQIWRDASPSANDLTDPQDQRARVKGFGQAAKTDASIRAGFHRLLRPRAKPLVERPRT
jgi:hypothetical protein